MDSVRVEQLENEGLARVTWLPFELHPEAPLEGIPRERYFGGERSRQMREHMRSIAESVGLKMTTRDVIINSRRALGAAEFARDSGRFEAMHRALFQAHWEGTARLEDVDDLVRVGEGVGLDGAELREALESNRYDVVIDENRRMASGAGIDAIPAHVFDRRFLVLGAQPYDVLKHAIERIQAMPAQ